MTVKLRVVPDPMILTPMQRITSQQVFDFQRQVGILTDQTLKRLERIEDEMERLSSQVKLGMISLEEARKQIRGL